ncbi:MAG: pyridoxamine 5'-phosphate oxidase family protein [Rhodospirillales bacterium]|nr:pyridoxamine 5'-phosphate oxidase family protein [Rhodospirillales bacterium]
MARIESLEQLRSLYAHPKGRPLTKQIDHLEKHCRQFISLSPFLVLSTSAGGQMHDASPRGEDPGFVKVLDDYRIAIPDRPGNNRLDTYSNILDTPNVGLIFLIPGVNETLRINGEAEIRDDQALIELFDGHSRPPKTVLVVHVKEAYLHCAKALMRSKLWEEDFKIPRDQLPTAGEMINDQSNTTAPLETQEEMETRYRDQLY